MTAEWLTLDGARMWRLNQLQFESMIRITIGWDDVDPKGMNAAEYARIVQDRIRTELNRLLDEDKDDDISTDK